MTQPNFPDKIKSLTPFSGRFDAYTLTADGCKIFFAHYPAATKIEPHKHETDNYGIIIQGELFLTIAGEEKRFRTGEWYYVPAYTEHSARFEELTSEIEFWFEE
jgi:quercetin dioxygenase-like cupin family protein